MFGYEGEVHIWRGGVVDFGFVCMYELLGVCECVSMRLHTYIADLGGGTVQAAQWTEAGKSKRTAGHRVVVGTEIAGDCSVHSPGPDRPDKKKLHHHVRGSARKPAVISRPGLANLSRDHVSYIDRVAAASRRDI